MEARNKRGSTKMSEGLRTRSCSIIQEYLSISTIHGLFYLGARETSIIAKIVWFILVVLAITIGSLMMERVLENWEENPVLTSLDNAAQSLEQTQYPTITICPNVGYDRWRPVIAKLNAIYEKCQHIQNSTVDNDCNVMGKIEIIMDLLKDRFMSMLDRAIERTTLKIQDTYWLKRWKKVLDSQGKQNNTVMDDLPNVMWESMYKGKKIIYNLLNTSHKELIKIQEAVDDNRTKNDCKMVKTVIQLGFFLSLPKLGLTPVSLLEFFIPVLIGKTFSEHNYIPATDEEIAKSYAPHDADFLFSDIQMQIHKALPEIQDVSLFEITSIFKPTKQEPFFPQRRQVDELYPYSIITHAKKNNYTSHNRLRRLISFSKDKNNYFGNLLGKDFAELLSILLQAYKGDPSQVRGKNLVSGAVNGIILQSSSEDEVDLQPKLNLVFTDKGLCQSYNALPADKVFKDDMEYMKILGNLTNIRKNDVIMISNSGEGSRRSLILDANLAFKDPQSPGSFKVSINNMYNFIDTSSSFIEVNVGYKYLIRITPTQYTTSSDFLSIPPEKRKCLYLHENPNADSIFKFYSQKTCFYECQLNLSYNKTGCYPWFTPHWNISANICDGYNSQFFLYKDFKVQCNCPANCEEVVFNTKETGVPINIEKQCQGGKVYEYYLKQLVMKNKFLLNSKRPQMLSWRLFQLKHNMDIPLKNITSHGIFPSRIPLEEHNAICREYFSQDIALLDIEIAVPQMKSIKRERRVTFADKLGTVG